jgi:hypothetical protein
VLALASGGIGFVGYLVAWIIIPEEPVIVPQAYPAPSQPSTPSA